MRLIDADAYAFPGDLVDEPTIDAVQVVRCKDCAYYVPLGDAYEYKGKKAMHCWLECKPTPENYYCACGVRKSVTDINVGAKRSESMHIHDMTEEAYKNGYKDGIKKFAEMLKEVIRDMRFLEEAERQCEYIDDLVKEMVGDNNDI